LLYLNILFAIFQAFSLNSLLCVNETDEFCFKSLLLANDVEEFYCGSLYLVKDRLDLMMSYSN